MTGAAALLAHDPAVPHRDILINPIEMQQRLARHLPHTSIHSVEAVRVKYRVGDSLRVVYRLKTGGDDIVVTGRTFASATRDGGTDSDRDQYPSYKKLPSAFTDPHLEILFWIFPDDRRLSHVRAALQPTPDLAAHLNGAWWTSRLVGYAPEKSAVVACLNAAGTAIAYAKVFQSGDDAQRTFRMQRAMCELASQSARLRIPQPVCCDIARSLLVTAVAPGTRLTDVTASAAPTAVGRLGEAIGHLHGLDIPAAALPLRRATPHTLRFAADLIGRTQPSLHDDVGQLAEELIAGAPDERDAVLLHGDLHLKNVMLDDDRLWLIDFDRVACGPPASEIGSFLALLGSRVGAHLMSAAEAFVLGNRFLEGYASVRPLPAPAVIRWHTAAALIDERALRAVSRLRLPIIRNLPRLISEARRLLHHGGAR